MNQSDIAIATGGVSAPLWLPALNEWVALFVGIMSIMYLAMKIYKYWKDTNNQESQLLAELAAANAAFAIIKKTIANGKDVVDCGKAISNFVTAKDELHTRGNKKKNSKWRSNNDLEEFIALEQINKKEEQLKELMIYYGRPGLWQDWIKFQAQCRKQRQEDKIRREHEREQLVEWMTIFGLIAIGTAIVAYFFYLVLIATRG